MTADPYRTDSNTQPPNFPTPEELQKKLSEFMKQHFGENVNIQGFAPEPETGSTKDSTDATGTLSSLFEFKLKPKDITAYLDRYVIRQEEAKKALAIAVCDHYNHVKLVEDQGESKAANYTKQNVILLGPTGVGKTYLIRCIAELIGVPFVKADATKFSETGYVGGDVEDIIRELIQRADGDVKLAQYGIVYIDEIDKIATSSNMTGRDVSGRGVQTNLLKLMEETEVPIRSQMDLQSQLQAAMEFQRRGGKAKKETINTRHILFIVSGAFDRLDEIIRTRLKQTNIGFGAKEEILRSDESSSHLFRHVTTGDFVRFGFEPEFVGRLPVRVVCDELAAGDLFDILKYSEGSIIRQYEQAFRAYGIEVMFNDEGLHAIAEKAALEKTGARGLMTVCEKTLRDFKYELPSTEIKRFVVNRQLVEHPHLELRKILNESSYEERQVLQEVAVEWCKRYHDKHGLHIQFSEGAMKKLIDRALQERKGIREICDHVFKDYQFGLNLVKKNSGQTEFTLPPEAVDDPDRVLSEMVVKSYRDD